MAPLQRNHGSLHKKMQHSTHDNARPHNERSVSRSEARTGSQARPNGGPQENARAEDEEISLEEEEVYELAQSDDAVASVTRQNTQLHNGDALRRQAEGPIDNNDKEDDDDDEDDYTGAGQISDDDSGVDEDEGQVLRAAEEDLIHEFQRSEQRRNANSIMTGLDHMFIQEQENTDGLSESLFPTTQTNFNMNEDPFIGLESSDSLYQEMWNDAEDALASWRLSVPTVTRPDSPDASGIKKRVRFEEESARGQRSRTSSTSSSEDAGETFPDLFTPQDDIMLRQRFAIDVDSDAVAPQDFSDAGSFYDFDGEEERLAFAMDDDSDTEDEASSDFSSEGEGDTTDEETEEETMARFRMMKEAARPIPKSPQLAPSTPLAGKRSVSKSSQSARRLSTPKTSTGPRTGTFVHDPTRAAMSADLTGKKVKVIPPVRPLEKDRAFWHRARTAATSRDTSPVSSPGFNTRVSNTIGFPARPFTAQSTLGSMFNGNLDILHTIDDAGESREFTSVVSQSTHLPVFESTSTFQGDSDEDESDDVNMQDFIDMDGYDSESETDVLPDSLMTPSQHEDPDAFTLSLERQERSGLLDHLDQQRGLVGSFRRNQNHAKHLSSLASHPAKRASTLESNALQKGRRGAANTPMTPARKKRGSQDLTVTGAGVKKWTNSPLTGRRPRSRGTSISNTGLQQTLGVSLMQ